MIVGRGSRQITLEHLPPDVRRSGGASAAQPRAAHAARCRARAHRANAPRAQRESHACRAGARHLARHADQQDQGVSARSAGPDLRRRRTRETLRGCRSFISGGSPRRPLRSPQEHDSDREQRRPGSDGVPRMRQRGARIGGVSVRRLRDVPVPALHLQGCHALRRLPGEAEGTRHAKE